MSVGKYSPTVSNSYAKDQDWWDKSSKDGFVDKDGYDSYGYFGRMGDGPDRAGHRENDYLMACDYNGETPNYYLFESVLGDWANVFLGEEAPSPRKNSLK